MDAFSGINLAPDLSAFKKNTNTSMKRVRDDNLTPYSVTQNRMGEGIATKTSRDIGIQGTITEYRDTVVDVLDGIVGMLSGGLLNTKDITKSIKVGRDGVVFDENSILAAASRSLGYPVSSTDGAMRKIAGDINAEFRRVTGLNIGGLVTSSGEGFRVTKNWRGKVGSETMKMLGKLTGIDQFIDRSVTTAVYNSMYYQTAQFGMSNGYRSIWNGYPTGFGVARRDATIEAMQYMITNGDVTSINEVLKLLDEDDGGLGTNRKIIMSKYPNFIENLFSNFKFDDDVFPEDYPALLATLLSVLERIVGAEWWKTYTEFGKVLNLTFMSRVSKDMVTLLSGYDPIVPLLCTAGKFQEVNCLVELRNQFKGAPQFPR